MINKLKNQAGWGVLIILAACILPSLIKHMIKEHQLVNEKSKIITISYYFPHFPYFADIVSGEKQPNKELMDGYHFSRPYIFHTYYQRAVDLLTDNDSARYLLGFCDYYMGQGKEAQKHYEKALEINKYFFWVYYNLGIIYFQEQDYLRSATVLTNALRLNKNITLEILHQSAFYRQIWRNLPNPPQVLESNLQEGFQDAAFLLASCYLKAGGFDPALQLVGSLGQNQYHQDIGRVVQKMALSHQRSSDELERLIKVYIPIRLF